MRWTRKVNRRASANSTAVSTWCSTAAPDDRVAPDVEDVGEVRIDGDLDRQPDRPPGVVHDVEVLVNALADGSVDARRVRIPRSLDAGLDREAAIAVRQWRFRPSMLLGRPVASRVTVELVFTLR